MCGICGKICFKGEVISRELIAAMNRTLVHRGPDDEGVFTAPYVGLGQRRLSIIDLQPAATAPLANEDETVWVVFNGEIYNFQTLRAELIEKGHCFRTKTDTEVIVHLYEEYGVECLAKMRGMFAFALWDAKKKQLFAARDRLGKKPFCYAKTPGTFVFGSAIKAITTDPEVSVSPDFPAIDSYLTYGYVPSPRSAFEGINKLRPGHYLTCTADGRLDIQRYWEPPMAEKTTIPEQEIGEEILRLLRESVKLRMISDVPLGAFLSGGIDSTTVVAVMAGESSHPVKTFSIGFEENGYNELPYARLLAERYGTEHHEFVVKPDAAEVLPLLVRHYNEPFADCSALPTYYVSKMTREHVTVALSGDGGDESFAGYDRYGRLLNWNRFDAIPFPLRRVLAGCARRSLDCLPYHNTTARVRRGLAMIQSGLRDRYLLEMTAGLKAEEKRIAYTRKFKGLLEGSNGYTDPLVAHPYECGMDAVDWMMRHDQSFYLPDDLMVKSDIASMANSLEVRCPILDQHVVEFAATIPSSMKRNGAIGKMIFKNAVNDLLPPEILAKRKTGFGVPIDKWFQGELTGMLRENLLDKRAARRELFEPVILKRMVDEHVAGKRGWSNRLWTLLFLELWFREFID